MIAALICTVLIHGTSMLPGLEPGREYIFRGVRDTTIISIGDTVLVHASPRPIVKRVVAIDSLYRLSHGRWAKRGWILAIKSSNISSRELSKIHREFSPIERDSDRKRLFRE